MPLRLTSNFSTHSWRETAEGHWTGVMGGRVWTLTQTEDTLWYHVYKNQESPREGDDGMTGAGVSLQLDDKSKKRFRKVCKIKEVEEPAVMTGAQDTDEEQEALRDYFQLNVKLQDLYDKWGDTDPNFRRIADVFTGQFVCVCTCRISLIASHILFGLSSGVRMLRQDPTECLFSFICTSNNHISRIHSMVERLCQALGAPLCQLDQTSYYNFPTLSALAGALFHYSSTSTSLFIIF